MARTARNARALGRIIGENDPASRMTKWDNGNGITEVLNLLHHRQCTEVDDGNLVIAQGLRYTFASRADVVTRALEQWLQ